MAYQTDPMIEQKRMLYFTSLLNETLPSSMLNHALMAELGLEPNDMIGLVHILFDNQLKATIEAKDVDYVADWKIKIHQHMLEVFDGPWIRSSCILNLMPYSRTIVYSFKAQDLAAIQGHITAWFHQLKDDIYEETGGHMMAFANPQLIPFKDIGKLYKELRRLLNFQYTLGMNTLTFYEDVHFTEQYSVAEYKYIQSYEQLLTREDYQGLLDLNEEIKAYILSYKIKDSKVIYIYKELMSITIRHLYNHETDHLQLIESLNHAINNFAAVFNDLNDVSAHIDSLIKAMDKAASPKTSYHPHIKKTLALIKDHYQTDLTLDHIADQLNLSSAHLSRLFKEEMGITYKQYLTKYRMDIIKDLLKNTQKSIQDIAHQTGYQSPNQLTRIFKKYEQITPTSYRLRHRS